MVLHVQVHYMGAACRMYPLHLDAGTTRRWTTLRADGMPVQIARRVGSVAGQRSGAPEHGRYGCFLLTGAVRLLTLAQIGLVSQAELGLWLGRAMAIRFLGSENTSTITSLKRRILQSERMGPLRK